MTTSNPLGMAVTVENFEDQALQVSFDECCTPEIRQSSDGSTEIVLTIEHLTYALACAIDALENYEEDDEEE